MLRILVAGALRGALSLAVAAGMILALALRESESVSAAQIAPWLAAVREGIAEAWRTLGPVSLGLLVCGLALAHAASVLTASARPGTAMAGAWAEAAALLGRDAGRVAALLPVLAAAAGLAEIGGAFVAACIARDWPMVGALLLILTAFAALARLIGDLLAAALDPARRANARP